MFLHIGAGVCAPIKDIVLILGCETEMPEITREALKTLESTDAGGMRRSAVLTPGRAYYSPIAQNTLRKRLRKLLELM
jgi:hypothetical protein